MSSEQSILSLQASLASLIVSLASGKPAKTNATYGLKSLGLSAQRTHDGSWAKTFQGFSQVSLEGFSAASYPTWTRWGIVSDGACTGLERLVHHIGESESSLWPTPRAMPGNYSRVNGKIYETSLQSMARRGLLWPTPTANDANGSRNFKTDGTRYREAGTYGPTLIDTVQQMWPTPTAIDSGSGRINKSTYPGAKERPTLAYMARKDLWPTPQSRDYRSGSEPNSKRSLRKAQQGWSPNLNDVVMWPTPTARDWKSGTGAQNREGHAPPLTDVVKSQLNPAWVECLMGFPEGWTDIDGLRDPEKYKKPGRSRASSRKNNRIAINA